MHEIISCFYFGISFSVYHTALHYWIQNQNPHRQSIGPRTRTLTFSVYYCYNFPEFINFPICRCLQMLLYFLLLFWYFAVQPKKKAESKIIWSMQILKWGRSKYFFGYSIFMKSYFYDDRRGVVTGDFMPPECVDLIKCIANKCWNNEGHRY